MLGGLDLFLDLLDVGAFSPSPSSFWMALTCSFR
jgi:hypothetical protein